MLTVHSPHRPSAHVALMLAIAGAAAAVAGVISLPPESVHASDPMGIYTLVEDVAIESTKPGEPERVRVYGISALAYRPPAEGGRFQGGVYSTPTSGYLYFTCPEGKAEVCRMEWADLQKAVGDERCAAYGDRYLTDPKPNGRLRPLDEPPDAPDTYPIAQGVILTRQGSQGTCDAIRELAAGAAPTATGAQDSGSYLPNIAADAAGDSAAAEPSGNAAVKATAAPAGASDTAASAPVDAVGASDGGGTGPASLPPLAALVLLGLGALGIATAAAWSRRRA